MTWKDFMTRFKEEKVFPIKIMLISKEMESRFQQRKRKHVQILEPNASSKKSKLFENPTKKNKSFPKCDNYRKNLQVEGR